MERNLRKMKEKVDCMARFGSEVGQSTKVLNNKYNN
jgi:hypothetical protein